MKTDKRPPHTGNLIFVALAFAFLLAANSLAVAQAKKYKPGDRVECDYTQSGRFSKGTVVPYEKTDLDKESGRWYRVKLDEDRIPNSTAECMANRMRPLAVDNTNSSENGDEEDTTPDAVADASDHPGGAAKFKPGDRVECDKAQIGRWEKGTVMHYLPDDTDKGSYIRVRLDGYKLYPEGHQCMNKFVRSIGGKPLGSLGKYKVGDAIEAQNHNGSWLPGKIIGVEGAFYKVRFDNRDSRYDEKIDDKRIRRIGSGDEAPIKPQTPPTRSAPHSLPGTAWKIDFGSGVTGTIFLFCKTGTWEIVPARAGTIGAVGKSYSVSGSTLTTVNRDDGKVQKWKMSWAGDVLVINDGKQTLRLHYNGETQCR